MTLEQAEEIAEVVRMDLKLDLDVRDDYSGRGMFGDRVPAFVTDDGMEAMTAIGYAAAKLGIPFGDLPFRSDALGHGIVVY